MVTDQNLETTLKVLGSTANEAAVPVLLAALDGAEPRSRDGVFRTLLARRSDLAEGEVLRRWPQLSNHWKRLVCRREGWLSGAVRSAMMGNDENLAHSACAAALYLREYELIPALVSAASKGLGDFSLRAAETLLVLAEQLAEEVHSPRDYRIRRDPQMQRTHALCSLEASVQGPETAHRPEILEAFLLLASRNNAVLNKVLQDPADRSYRRIMELLASSPRGAIIRLLLAYLDDPFAPLAALQALASRRDISFLRQLFRKVGDEPSAAIRGNLKRIENVPWLGPCRFLLDSLQEAEQPGAVRFVAACTLPRPEALQGVTHLLAHGKQAGRRSASQALAAFPGEEADAAALAALEDEDVQVRANIASQLRDRRIPGSMKHLLSMLDSPHEFEREVARACLDEFRFVTYVASFDYWDEEVRRRIGELVRRVDPNAVPLLREELASTSRTRRRRALEMALYMDAAADAADLIAEMARDDDQYIRLEAVRLLGICPTTVSGQVLREALGDRRALVQEAAQHGLEELEGHVGRDTDVISPSRDQAAQAENLICPTREALST